MNRVRSKGTVSVTLSRAPQSAARTPCLAANRCHAYEYAGTKCNRVSENPTFYRILNMCNSMKSSDLCSEWENPARLLPIENHSKQHVLPQDKQVRAVAWLVAVRAEQLIASAHRHAAHYHTLLVRDRLAGRKGEGPKRVEAWE